MTLTPAQLKYVMRGIFSDGIPLGVACTTNVVEDLTALRRQMLTRGYGAEDACFLFRRSNWIDMGPVTFKPGDNSYFVGFQDVTRLQVDWSGEYKDMREKKVRDVSRASQMSDEEFRQELLMSQSKDYSRIRFGLNVRILLQNPEVMCSLEEYLSMCLYADIWEERFPGGIDTCVTGRDLYGENPPSTDLVALLTPLLGDQAGRAAHEIKKKLS